MEYGTKTLCFLITICCSLLFSFNGIAQTIKPYTGLMPVPSVSKNMLFYLQRTINANTLIYEINYKENGQINKSKPVNIYWIEFDNNGKMTPLTYIQEKFAYGVEYEELDGSEIIFVINIVSYKKIKIYLKPSEEDGSYRAYVPINGKESMLTNILINIVGGTAVKPVVSHIELFGKDLSTGESVNEKISP